MTAPLLELQQVGRSFDSAAGPVSVLRQLNIRIQAGEMLAIVGASGSGKSTLMNILGCLDRPSQGVYRVAGVDVSTLAPDRLASLRREYFGFVFQRYHLLPQLDAIDNVSMPAVYAGQGLAARRQRAAMLLQRLGLGAWLTQRSHQLSGGQQQRVSIARALMNGGAVILADEPTGALDSQSGQQVIAILRELNQRGHTVIIVTHDQQIAATADRVIELRDGELVADSGSVVRVHDSLSPLQPKSDFIWGRLVDAFKMAWFSLCANRLRTILTMFGILIGIASVMSIVALGQGAREVVLKDIRAIGPNTIMVYRGQDWGDDKAGSIRTLLPGDLSMLAAEPYVDSVTPETIRPMRLRWGNADLEAHVFGGGADLFRVKGRSMALGRSFSAEDVQRQAQVVVLDQYARRKLFGERQDVLGQVVLVGSMPAQVIGVLSQEHEQAMGNQVLVWLPYTTAASRLFGQAHFDQLTVRVREGAPMEQAEKQIGRLLSLQHAGKDFFTHNLDSVFKSINRITATLSLLLSMVALISLLVGGIGVMNIMLVSVAERTREIGIRMAVGARQRDVMLQFLIESVLVCLAGGVLGVGLALALGAVFSRLVTAFDMVFSLWSVLVALGSSMLIGVLFGFLPARNAARLDPVVALARE